MMWPSPHGGLRLSTAEVALHVLGHISDPANRCTKIIRAHTKLRGSVPDLIVLFQADALAVLAASLAFVVSHCALPCRDFRGP